MLRKRSVAGTSKAKGRWRNMGGHSGVVRAAEHTEQKNGADGSRAESADVSGALEASLSSRWSVRSRDLSMQPSDFNRSLFIASVSAQRRFCRNLPSPSSSLGFWRQCCTVEWILPSTYHLEWVSVSCNQLCPQTTWCLYRGPSWKGGWDNRPSCHFVIGRVPSLPLR